MGNRCWILAGGSAIVSNFLHMRLTIHIDDLIKSHPGSSPLTGLKGDALQAAVGDLLSEVFPGAEISVSDETATVVLQDIGNARMAEADRLAAKASKRAREGEFAKAAAIFRTVLEINPARYDARRELAMALIELGDHEAAKDLLLDALKADPNDAQALVILGNHYARQEGDLVTAERFFRRAIEVAPDDATAHNSLGGMLVEENAEDEALSAFDEALRLRPEFAQPRYGRAMLFLNQGAISKARDELASMFKESDIQESRSLAMLQTARNAYLKLVNILANENASTSDLATREMFDRAGENSGFPAAIERA